MIYCTKCGTKNEDKSIHCRECGAILKSFEAEKITSEPIGRSFDDDCFSLPYGGAVVGLIIGLLVIFSGLMAFFAGSLGRIMGQFSRWMGNWGREFGEAIRNIINVQSMRIFRSLMMIIIGFMIIVAVLYNLNQNRSINRL